MIVPDTGDDFSSSKFNFRTALCRLCDALATFFEACSGAKLGVVTGDMSWSFFFVCVGEDGEGVDGGVIGVVGLNDKSSATSAVSSKGSEN